MEGATISLPEELSLALLEVTLGGDGIRRPSEDLILIFGFLKTFVMIGRWMDTCSSVITWHEKIEIRSSDKWLGRVTIWNISHRWNMAGNIDVCWHRSIPHGANCLKQPLFLIQPRSCEYCPSDLIYAWPSSSSQRFFGATAYDLAESFRSIELPRLYLGTDVFILFIELKCIIMEPRSRWCFRPRHQYSVNFG